MSQLFQRGFMMPRMRGIKVFHLNIGQPDLPSPPEIFSGLKV